MAQTGFTPIKIYASSTAAAAPSASNLDNTNGAELAINITDGKLFYKDNANAVQVIAGNGVTIPSAITVNSTSAALTVTQTGTGNAFVVEDSTSPDASPFVIDANGNVGIGVTSTNGYKVAVGGSGLKNQFISTDANNAYLYTDGSAYFGSTNAFNDVFITNNIERMRIDSSGNVGIGTSSPAQRLDLGTGSLNVGAYIFTGAGVSTGDVAIELGANRSASGNSYFDFHSTSGSDFESRILRNSGVNGGLQMLNSGLGELQLNQIGASPITFLTSATERMRIDSSGNVGIGTNSPGAKLDINGLARSSIGTGTGAGGAAYAFYQFGTSATSTENWHIGTEGDGSFRFYNQGFGAGTERMRINSAGAVSFGSSGTAFGTAGQILTSNGSGASPSFQTPASAGGFPAGTLMLFQQTAAPTGWTKQTTHDNKALRVVSGTASTGGAVAFTTAFAAGSTGATTLTTTQIPSHSHTLPAINYISDNGQFGSQLGAPRTPANSSNATGGGGSHTHSLALNVSYVDLIIASKD